MQALDSTPKTRQAFPLISVIVPIYNVEPWLREALDSLLAQTYPHWEALLVDDGSPDNCGAIIEEYAARDSRFRALHQANAGVSAARNTGMSAMTGDYFAFLDPDDSLPPDSLEFRLGLCLRHGTVICASVSDGEDEPTEGTVLSGDTLFARFGCVGPGHVYSLFHAPLARFRFDETLHGAEDLAWLGDLHAQGFPVAVGKRQVYRYRIREDSLCHAIPTIRSILIALRAYERCRPRFTDGILKREALILSASGINALLPPILWVTKRTRSTGRERCELRRRMRSLLRYGHWTTLTPPRSSHVLLWMFALTGWRKPLKAVVRCNPSKAL